MAAVARRVGLLNQPWQLGESDAARGALVETIYLAEASRHSGMRSHSFDRPV
jgi:hypothetical protein